MTHAKKNGFSLIELMVAMAITAIVTIAIVSTYTVQVTAKNTQEALTDMNQAARAALEIMAQEIRMAGLDPTEDAGAQIILADVGDLRFSLDRRDNAGTNAPDGDCCDGNEVIRYHLSPGARDANNDGVNDNILGGVECNLGRETWEGYIPGNPCGAGAAPGLQPLARNVDVLNFVYLDGTGAVIPSPVAANRLDDIRAIEVTIVARAGTESQGFLNVYTNTETYPNLRPVADPDYFEFDPPNDGFRRLRLATTIACRNVGL